MKLNPDCIRDILLTIEENTDLNSSMDYPNDYDRLSKYSNDEVLYHIKQCELSEFVTDIEWFIGDSCSVEYLSPEGHEFIANIRLDTNWNKTKEFAKKTGSTSLDAIKDIASNVITELIKSQF